MYRITRITIVCLCSILYAGLAVYDASAPTYKILGEYNLTGTTVHGIAIDSDSRRLFLAGDDGITVLNADTGAKLGDIQIKDAQDVLLIPVANGEEQGASTKGFATGNGKVIAFSLADMKPDLQKSCPRRVPLRYAMTRM
jgi:hypothetical protein